MEQILLGNGYSNWLNESNATLSLTNDDLSDYPIINELGLYLESGEGDGYSWFDASLENWNTIGFKSLNVNGSYDYQTVSNFVDVSIVNTNLSGAFIDIYDAKRGSVITGDGDDIVNLSLKSNSASWSNQFLISTGNGDDEIVVTNSLNSQFTALNIDSGNGDDIVDISGVANALDGVERDINGGDGNDILYIGNDIQVEFSNFELVIASDDTTLNLTEELLIENNSQNTQNMGGVIFSGFDIVINDEFTIEMVDRTISEEDDMIDYYGLGLDSSDFYWVSFVSDSGESYNILTDDSDFEAYFVDSGL